MSDEGSLEAPDSTAGGDEFQTVELPYRVQKVSRFRLTVTEGESTGLTWESTSERCSIGTHEENNVVVVDPAVSRVHCSISIDGDGARLRDLGSRNGTVVNGMRVFDAFLVPNTTIRVGNTAIRFELADGDHRLYVSRRTEFGPLVGESRAMRTVFAALERASVTNATVLLEGETGTGKGEAADCIHQGGVRARNSLVVVDCGAIPANLIESELFGHEKGAFTGAHSRRIGAFEEASGGTIFLDEIGELPLAVQPKLLRALEHRQVRRLGSNVYTPVDVRVVAATHRDLRADVNAGRFRADLYFRLAVVRITMPPLRDHVEDMPTLARKLVQSLGSRPEDVEHILTPEFMAELESAHWPGNVRELRNYLERCLVFQEALPIESLTGPPAESPQPDGPSLSYARAKEKASVDFERRYLKALMRAHGDNIVAAANASGLSRVYLYQLLRKHREAIE